MTSFSSNESFLGQKNTTCDIFDNPLLVKTGIILALSIILLISFVGNILIIITVYKREELRKTINFFIANMAVSDFVYPLTIIPLSLIEIASSSRQWYIGGTVGLFFCKITRFLQHVSVSVSVASLIWIALDRFVAVVLPMKVHLISVKFRVFAISSTWILAMAVHSSDLYTYRLVEMNKEISCKHVKNEIFSFMNDGKVHVYVLHVLPLITLAILYCLIAVTLRKQDKVLGSAEPHQHNQRKRQAIKMSLCTIAAFCICTLPLTLLNIVDDYKIQVPCKLYKPFSFLSDLVFYLSSGINPLICFSFVGSYRHGLKEILNFSPDSCFKKQSTERNMETDGTDGITLHRFKAGNYGSGRVTPKTSREFLRIE